MFLTISKRSYLYYQNKGKSPMSEDSVDFLSRYLENKKIGISLRPL